MTSSFAVWRQRWVTSNDGHIKFHEFWWAPSCYQHSAWKSAHNTKPCSYMHAIFWIGKAVSSATFNAAMKLLMMGSGVTKLYLLQAFNWNVIRLEKCFALWHMCGYFHSILIPITEISHLCNQFLNLTPTPFNAPGWVCSQMETMFDNESRCATKYKLIQWRHKCTKTHKNVQWSTMKYNEVQWSTVKYKEVQWSTMKYYEVQWSTWSTVKYNEVQWNTMKHNETQ